ncbi:hypothetical protein KOI35_22690 [Actinoplanes bogorensis]|uniref:Uncharacterized protein n=1 Tax=Paractinoplanes bogorensis TaxID=1610840 RepID=A0ABS5YS89_9ACTN|nr:hypothetical protein [Actinoplanes bogorensis]MBU2666314.1 hypothetical protein [Actinoplanes bogorensis]
MVQFYDNGDVDRVYGIHYDMTTEQWQHLAEIYRSLPGSSADLAGAWFGPEGSPDGWLVASIEPSGLHVYGELPAADWHRWTTAFEAAVDASDFPLIDLADLAGFSDLAGLAGLADE